MVSPGMIGHNGGITQGPRHKTKDGYRSLVDEHDEELLSNIIVDSMERVEQSQTLYWPVGPIVILDPMTHST